MGITSYSYWWPFYSVGAIFYALKRPGRDAKYFGFHELFHIFVLAAWISQYIAISVAITVSKALL